MRARASRRLKAVAIGVGAALSASMVFAAPVSATPLSLFPGLPDSATLSGPILATGPASGAITVLDVDPTPTELLTHHDDNALPVSQATTVNGHWALRAGTIPADRVGPAGTVNFTVVTDTGHSVEVGFFGEANLHRPAATQRIGMKPMGAAPSGAQSSGSEPNLAPGECEPSSGPSKTVVDLVGQTFSSKKDGSQSFTYSDGASTTVGVGYNASLSGGTWSQNDTHVFGSTATASYGTKDGRASMYYEAEFQGDIVTWNCYGLPGDAGYRTTAITGYDGAGYREQVKKAPWNARDCVTQGGGMTITISKTSAVTWSNGLDFTKFGITASLSSQTGYSKDAETINHWDSRGLFCGVNAPPNNKGALINVER